MGDMKKTLHFSLHVLAICLYAGQLMAAESVQSPAMAMHDRIQQTVLQYVQAQTLGYPGKVEVKVHPLDARLRIASCDQIEAFTVQGSRLWGRTHVGVRCAAGLATDQAKPWTLYVQTDVQVWGEYVVTALPVGQGSALGAADVVLQRGDLSKLPNGIVTDLNMVSGKQAALNLPAGTVLRPELLKAVAVIQQGQTVQLSSSGPGFVVTKDGTAMRAAHVGQVVDVKVSNGQIVKGVASATGKVEVNF